MPNPLNFPNQVTSSLRSALYLAITVFFIWFWVNNPILGQYNLELTGVLVVGYFTIRLLAKSYLSANTNHQLALDANIITAVTLLLTAITGGLNSPLFFLIYFLLFAIAFIFDPPVTLIITICLALFFSDSLTGLRGALQLVSLLFFAPMAIYFSKQYYRLLIAKQAIIDLKRNEKDLNNTLSAQETNILIWLSLDFKSQLVSIIHQTAELLSDIGRLTFRQKERIEQIHRAAKNILSEGEKLEKQVDRESDKEKR